MGFWLMSKMACCTLGLEKPAARSGVASTCTGGTQPHQGGTQSTSRAAITLEPAGGSKAKRKYTLAGATTVACKYGTTGTQLCCSCAT
jgi:hypothetical protein